MTERVDTLEIKMQRIQRLLWIILAINLLKLVLELSGLHAPALLNAPRADPVPGTNSNSVHIGTAAPVEPENRKTYLSVADVARQTGLSPRTVADYCATGRISPPPVKTERAWQIAAEYRILPQTAALCGTASAE